MYFVSNVFRVLNVKVNIKYATYLEKTESSAGILWWCSADGRTQSVRYSTNLFLSFTSWWSKSSPLLAMTWKQEKHNRLKQTYSQPNWAAPLLDASSTTITTSAQQNTKTWPNLVSSMAYYWTIITEDWQPLSEVWWSNWVDSYFSWSETILNCD